MKTRGPGGLRSLLGFLSRRPRDAGFESEAEALESFAGERRRLLVEAGEAHILARYSEASHTRSDAESW